MNRARVFWSLCVTLLCVTPAARAQHGGGLDVELWTDRGHDAVYKPGDPLEVQVRTSEDAYLMVYEIDAEGRVRLVAPEWGARGYVAGGETFEVPSPRSDFELVVDGPVGQGYLVAIASREPFLPMPWYLRPYNAQAEEIGYVGASDDVEEGVTAEGRIVGDPFVAMERIRRRVLAEPEDEYSFATAYTSYYVHHAVRYPRYICNDCHVPNRWAWWDGFDPYYTSCSVVDFRVNYAWGWGPGYWFGHVPYYYYVVRESYRPRYRLFTTRDACFSSWDGRRRWTSLWGDNLRRYKTAPPPGYVAPNKFDERTRGYRQPPGFLAFGRNGETGRRASLVPSSRETRKNDDRLFRGDRGSSRGTTRGDRNLVGLGRREASTGRDFTRRTERFARPQERPAPSVAPRERSNGWRALSQPRHERPRVEQPRPRSEIRFEPRERSQRRFEQPRQRSEGGFPLRERSQTRYERPRVEQPRGRSEMRFEPRAQSRPRDEQPRARAESREQPRARFEQPRERVQSNGRSDKDDSRGSDQGRRGRGR